MARPAGLGYSRLVPTAGIIVIGNEILSGKVTDTNSPYLCRELRALGVDVERILTIPDVVDVIAPSVRAMSDAYDFVFTSGGIGPTHDDLTMDGIARAFGRELTLSSSIVDRIERAQGRAPNESQLKMAMIPAGASLVDAGDLWFPVVVVENVYVLPGVPELLREEVRFDPRALPRRAVPAEERLREAPRERDRRLAERAAAEFPELMLGSYPKIGEEDFHVLLTLESRDAAYLGRRSSRCCGASRPTRSTRSSSWTGRVVDPAPSGSPSCIRSGCSPRWRSPRRRCAPACGCARGGCAARPAVSPASGAGTCASRSQRAARPRRLPRSGRSRRCGCGAGTPSRRCTRAIALARGAALRRDGLARPPPRARRAPPGARLHALLAVAALLAGAAALGTGFVLLP